MIKFFSNNKIIFYFINFFFIILYIYPGSLIGLILYQDIKMQPQITPNFIISSNHFYVFLLISIIGFLSFYKSKYLKNLIIYLICLSIILESFHLVIPERSFEWSDLFGNLFGVIVVILTHNLINKYENFKK
jgi:NADH:ubiquinone oxidoreductase subunit K|tara:strand:+ start:29 stop:424 length:396 start_codon:yes stop_codon:yes gene_type:complete